MSRSAITSLLSLLLAAQAAAGTLKVPGQYASIQAAVNDATSGDVIVVAKGQYDSVLISNKSELVLRGKPGAEIQPIGPGIGIRVVQSDAIVIESITIRKTTGDGIEIENSNHVLVDRCRLEKIDGIGIETINGSHATLRRNSVHGVEQEGILVSSPRSSVLGNRIGECARAGIDVDKPDCRIEKNRISRAAYGIYLSGAFRSTVIGNRTSRTRNSGIRIDGSSHTIVQGNRFEKSDSSGIYVDSSNEVAVLKNEIRDMSTSAILIIDSDGVRTTSNEVERVHFGIYFLSSNDGRVEGNSVERARAQGILGNNCDNLSLVDNRSIRSGQRAYSLAGVTGAALVRNVARKSTADDLVITASSGILRVGNSFD